MKTTSAHPRMVAASGALVLNHFQNQVQEQEQELNQEQTQDSLGSAKTYNIEDIWGDAPTVTIYSSGEDAATPPAPDMDSESKRSWFERLISRFGGSEHRPLRIVQ